MLCTCVGTELVLLDRVSVSLGGGCELSTSSELGRCDVNELGGKRGRQRVTFPRKLPPTVILTT